MKKAGDEMPLRIKPSAVENLLGEKEYRKDLLRQVTYKKDDMRQFRRAYKMLAMALSHKTFSSGFHGRGGFLKQQKCILKMRFGASLEKHQRFLEEYLSQKNKKEVIEKPALFSSPEIPIDEYISGYQKSMVEKHFKFIISPESAKVDCKVLTENLVARMEKLTGYKFHWLAAVHKNTKHPHAHLLINGVDKNGKEVNCFRGAFLKQTIRELSRQICTELIGGRTKEQIEADIKNIPCRVGFTVIDKEIAVYETQNYSEKEKEIYPTKVISRDDTMYQRLCFLADLGFAQRDETKQNTFYLEKDWQNKLKTCSRYNSFLKARSEISLTQKESLELFTKDSPSVTGVVTKIYRMNYEESWNNAVLVENKETQKSYYVPLYGEPSDKVYATLLNSEILCVGETSDKGVFHPKIKIIKKNLSVSK